MARKTFSKRTPIANIIVIRSYLIWPSNRRPRDEERGGGLHHHTVILFIEEISCKKYGTMMTGKRAYQPKGNSYLELREFVEVSSESLQGYGDGDDVEYRFGEKSFEVVSSMLEWRRRIDSEDSDAGESGAAPIVRIKKRSVLLWSLLEWCRWTRLSDALVGHKGPESPECKTMEKDLQSKVRRSEARPHDERTPLLPSRYQVEKSEERGHARWVRFVIPFLMVIIVLDLWYWLLQHGWID